MLVSAKEETVIPAAPPVVEPVPSASALPPSIPKTQPKPQPPLPSSLTPLMPSKIPVKPKRSGFDVSKPLYKEPFKYGNYLFRKLNLISAVN